MSTPKNSRGPWRVHLVDETLIIDANGDSVATVFWYQADYEEHHERRAADALLISAALELRKACERAIAALSANGAPNCEAAKECRAAIAKATQPAASRGEATPNFTAELGA